MVRLNKRLRAGRCKPEGYCTEGHDQQAWYELTGRACPCWERKLPPTIGSHHKLVFDNRLEQYSDGSTPEDWLLHQMALEAREYEPDELRSDESLFLERLLEWGLSRRKADVVVARLCRGLTYKEIALELGYSGSGAASLAYADALKQLRRKLEEK